MSENEENVPKRRFKEFENADAWEQRKLGKLADVYDGTHETPNYTDSGVMFLSVENIKTLQSEKFISEEDFEKGFAIFPEKGDVLMTRIGDIGTANVVETDAPKAYYVSLALLKQKELNPYFLKESISSKAVKKELWKRTLHIAFPKKINKNEIANVIVQYPVSEDEQQKIGKLFRSLDDIITFHQRKLEKMKALKKAYLTDMFPIEGNHKPKLRFAGFKDDWEQRKLGKLYSFQYGQFNNNPSNGGEYPVFGANGIIGEYTEYNSENSVIIGHMGEYAGSVLWGEGKHFVTYNGTIARSNENELESKFGYYVLYRLDIRKTCGGSGMPFLSYDMLEKMDGIFPKDKKEQECISKFLARLDNLITLHQRKLDKLQNIKKAYLNEMFI